MNKVEITMRNARCYAVTIAGQRILLHPSFWCYKIFVGLVGMSINEILMFLHTFVCLFFFLTVIKNDPIPGCSQSRH